MKLKEFITVRLILWRLAQVSSVEARLTPGAVVFYDGPEGTSVDMGSMWKINGKWFCFFVSTNGTYKWL
jgi:hypothetical protein